MFKVKDTKTGEIVQVLDTFFDATYNYTYFLVWDNGWRYRPAKRYVPPNMEIKKEG